MKKNLLIVLALLILTACSSTGPSITGDWALVSYGDASNPTPALPDVDAHINFDDQGQMSGNVGCNGFRGAYELTGNEIAFNGVMSTMMFCDATSAQEQGVLSIFADKVQLQFQLNGNNLTITSADGASVVNLVRK